MVDTSPCTKGRRKVLVIGSGPIVIGQAAEFDYAGVCRESDTTVGLYVCTDLTPPVYSDNPFDVTVFGEYRFPPHQVCVEFGFWKSLA